MTLSIDTNISIDSRTIIGTNLPTVYFDKITINEMNGGILLKNGNYANFADDGKYLQTTLNVVLKDAYNGQYSTWFDNPHSQLIKKSVKVAVVQSTQQNTTDAWLNTDLPSIFTQIKNGSQDPSLTKYLAGVNIYTFSLSELEGDSNSKSLTSKFLNPSQNLSEVYDFNKQISFPLLQKTSGNDVVYLIPQNQKDLCYFAFTFIESDSTRPAFSKVTHEQVIKSGLTVNESSVFTTRNTGQVWTGEVHYHSGDIEINGEPYYGFMGGPAHNHSRSQPILEQTIVKNSTIHDMRSLNLVANNVLFKRSVEEKPNLKNSIKNNSIFSNVYLSREADGKVDFSFSIDMNALIKARTLDSSNLSNESINQFLKYVNIKNIKIYRSKYDPPKSVNSAYESSDVFNPVKKLTTADSTRLVKPIQALRRVTQLKNKPLKQTEKTSIRDQYRELIIEADKVDNELVVNKNYGDLKSTIAARSEIFLEDQTLDNIIYITGTDNSITEFNSGVYQYEIELEIEDNRADYYSELKRKLDKQAQNLLSITQLTNKSNYDPVMNKFKDSFVNELSYSDQTIGVSDNFWDLIPPLYMEALSLISFNKFPQPIKNNAENTMRNMLNPYSSDTKGYLKIIKMLQGMSQALSRNVYLSRKNYGPKDPSSSKLKSRASKNNYNPILNEVKISHVFNNSFVDASLIKHFGNIFFKMSPTELSNETAGIRTISYEKFIEYKNAEVEKIYSSPNADLSIASLPNAQMNLDLTSYSYFTPSVVYNKRKKPDCIESVLSFDEEYVDMVVTGLSSKDNLNLDSDLGSVGTEGLDKKINSINGRLDNFFANKFDVAAVTSQNAPKIFAAKEKSPVSSVTLNDVGGKFKKETTIKNQAASSVSNAKNVFKTLLNTTLVLKTEKPTVSAFSPAVLSTDCDEADDLVSSLPNPLKALVASQDRRKEQVFSPTPGIRPDIIDFINQDPFSNPNSINAAKNLFENIVVVQYLSGYYENEENQISVKDDRWKPLTKDVFNRSRNSNKKLLCRLLPYSSPRFNVKYDETIPIIDSYFFISQEEKNVISTPTVQPAISTAGISKTFDSPQYQMTFYQQESSPNISPLSRGELRNRPGQRRPNTRNIERPAARTFRGATTGGTTGGSSGGSSGGGY